MKEVIIIAVFIFLVARQQLNAVSYNLKKSYVQKWEFDGVTIHTDIEIENGSDIPLGVDGFLGSILYRGYEVAKVGLINKLSVPARSSAVITVGAKILYGPATGALLESIQSGRIESGLTIRGNILAGNAKIPVNTNYNLW